MSQFIEFVEQYKAVFITPFESEQSKKETLWSSMAALTSFTRSVLTEYLNVTRQCLQRERSIDKLTEELKAFYDGLQKPSELVPSFKCKDKGTELIESCIRTAMEREFVSTQKKQLLFLVDYLRDQYDIAVVRMESAEYNATNNEYHVKKAVNAVKKLGVECLNRLVPLTTNQSDLITILDLNFDDQLWSYTASTFRVFHQMIPTEFAEDAHQNGHDQEEDAHHLSEHDELIEAIYLRLCGELQPIKLLILSKVMVGIADHVVEEIIKHFKKNYLYEHKLKSASIGIYKQEVLLFKKYCYECSNGLRLMYSQRISEQIIASMPSTESMQALIDGVVSKMRKIYKMEEELSQCHLVQSNDSKHMLGGDREYDKLFNEGCLIYDKVSDDSHSVLFSIYKIVFKHWSETLRMRRIDAVEAHAVSQNVEYFRKHIPKIVHKKDFEKLQTLLDEVQQSAKGRCARSLHKNQNENENQNGQDTVIDID